MNTINQILAISKLTNYYLAPQSNPSDEWQTPDSNTTKSLTKMQSLKIDKEPSKLD